MKVDVELSDMVERKADGRGRIAIGPEYANKTITVAVVEVEEPDSE